jgi:hypothetical protein
VTRSFASHIVIGHYLSLNEKPPLVRCGYLTICVNLFASSCATDQMNDLHDNEKALKNDFDYY